MSKSYLDFEDEYGNAHATAQTLFDLMWSVSDDVDMKADDIRMIGRSGVKATEAMKKAFDDLMELYLKESKARRALEAGEAQS